MKFRMVGGAAGLILFVAALGFGIFWFASPQGSVIEVNDVWARSTQPGESSQSTGTLGGETMGEMSMGDPNALGTSAIYLVLRNRGRTGDRLVGVQTSAAGSAQIHRSQTKDGVTTMSMVSEIEIPARGKVEFKPGGFHIMLMDLEEPLKPGMKIQVTLVFEKFGPITVDAAVRGS